MKIVPQIQILTKILVHDTKQKLINTFTHKLTPFQPGNVRHTHLVSQFIESWGWDLK